MQINVKAATIADAFLPQQKLLRYLIMATLVAGGSAFVAGAAQVRIDMAFTPVPISGQTFAVLLVGAVLGSRLGLAAMLTYMAEGASGLPVFAGGTSGPSIISGPTGGYIIGFVFAAFVVGWLCERGLDRWAWTTALAMLIGNVVIYLFGLPWVAHWVGNDRVWAAGLFPFIPGDAIKLLLAASSVSTGWVALQTVSSAYGLSLPTGRSLGRPPISIVTTFKIPWDAIFIVAGAAVLAGTFLTWGTDVNAGERVNGIDAGEGVVTLAMGIAMIATGAASGLGLLTKAPTLNHLCKFTTSTVAAFVAYFEILNAATVSTFWLITPGLGLALIAAASIVAFLTAMAQSQPAPDVTASPSQPVK